MLNWQCSACGQDVKMNCIHVSQMSSSGVLLGQTSSLFLWVYRNIGTSSIKTGYIFPDGRVANSYHSIPKLLPSSCYYPTASFLWFFHSFVVSLDRFLTTHPTSCAPLPPALVHRPGVNSKNNVAFIMQTHRPSNSNLEPLRKQGQ